MGSLLLASGAHVIKIYHSFTIRRDFTRSTDPARRATGRARDREKDEPRPTKGSLLPLTATSVMNENMRFMTWPIPGSREA